MAAVNHENKLKRLRGDLQQLEDTTSQPPQSLIEQVLWDAQQSSDLNTILNRCVEAIQAFTNCQAVGIRILDDAGNIPYQAFRGFPQSFYLQENPLSIHKDQCMCIEVIKGTLDTDLPYITANGSFYMNGTTRFLATISAEDKGQTRNTCNQYGYESVALIPIRQNGHILGLIHVADTRLDRVPLKTVETLEVLALHLGTIVRRIRAEETIASLARFPEENPNPVFRLDQKGYLLYGNRSALRFLKQWGGNQVGSLAPPFWRDLSAEVYVGGRHYTRDLSAEGRIYSFAIEPLVDTGDINFYGTDITDRIQTERALRCSEEKYRTLFLNMVQGVFYQRADGELVDCNPAVLEMLGVDRDRFLGKDSADPQWRVLAQDGTELPVERHPSMVALNTGESVHNQVIAVFNPRKQDYVWLNVNAIPQFNPGEDKPYQVFVTLHDITQRRRSELALEASEEKYRLLFENMMDGFALHEVVFDDQGRPVDYLFLEVNSAFESLTGLDREHLLERRVTDVIVGIEQEWIEIYGKVAMTGQECRFEQYSEPLGRWYSVLAFSPKKGQFAALFEDITERKKAEKKEQDYQIRLKDLAAQLTLTEERQNQRLAEILHDEIGQALAFTKLQLQMWKEREEKPELSDDMSNLCDVVSGTIETIRSVTFSLNSPQLNQLGFERAVENWLSEQAQERYGVKTRFVNDGYDKGLDSDQEVILFRCIRELVVNAVKHAHANIIEVAMRRTDDHSIIQVNDDGHGFDASQVLQHPSGYGFGLFSIQERMEQLQGEFSVVSTPGHGCQTTLSIPVNTD